MPAETPQGVPESIILGHFSGLKNTIDRERLSPRDLAVGINIDLDDDGQPHRRRGRTLVASGNFHSLFQANDGTVYGVKDGQLGIVEPDYFFTSLSEVGGDVSAGDKNIAYWQIDGKIYFTASYCSGIISHAEGLVSDWGPAQSFWYSPVVNPTENLPAIRGKLYGGPPRADTLAYYNGRLYMSAGNMLWVTVFHLYHLVDKTRGFIQFEADITMVGAVSDGLYVGTTEGIYFLQGGSFEKLQRSRVMDAPAIPGTMVYVPQELANPPQVGQQADTPAQVSVSFMTTRGFCVGEEAGKCTNLTEGTFFFPVGVRGSAFFRRQDGMNHYVVCMDSEGGPMNGARYGDYVDVQLLRGVGDYTPSLPWVPGEITFPPAVPPDGFSGFGAVVYNATLTQALLANTPWQVSFVGVPVQVTSTLKGLVAEASYWNGSKLTFPSATTVVLIKVEVTVIPYVTGGFVEVAMGSSPTPPFGSEATASFSIGSGQAQTFTFTFPTLASEAGSYIVVSASVPAEITNVLLGIYPMTP